MSIPRDTLRSLERARARLRKTRSAAEEVGEDDRRYVEGYLRHPEQSGETAAVAEVVAATWERRE